VNAVLFAHVWRSQWLKLLIVALGLGTWGFLLPVVYATFGADIERFIEGGSFGEMFEIFSRFTGGDVFSLTGSLALGLVHPIPIALIAVFAVGFATTAVAGERQRGTLEVLLARPIDRRALYLTLLGAMLLFIAISLLAILVGAVAGAVLFDVAEDLRPGALAAAWLNSVLLYGAIGGLGLAASISFDRLTPALGATLAFTIASYTVYFLAVLWPDARWMAPYSVFHYLPASEVLGGDLDPGDVLVLGCVLAASVAYSLIVFPRRDLAAPS
jgi:ABC-type transport system involved in multi-copper enzyme maturation permease subunit